MREYERIKELTIYEMVDLIDSGKCSVCIFNNDITSCMNEKCKKGIYEFLAKEVKQYENEKTTIRK